MENITITYLDNEMKKLVPHPGYKLYNRVNDQYYSEAVVKDEKIYQAIKL